MQITLNLTKKEALDLEGALCMLHNRNHCAVTSTLEEYKAFLDKVISQIRKSKEGSATTKEGE